MFLLYASTLFRYINLTNKPAIINECSSHFWSLRSSQIIQNKNKNHKIPIVVCSVITQLVFLLGSNATKKLNLVENEPVKSKAVEREQEEVINENSTTDHGLNSLDNSAMQKETQEMLEDSAGIFVQKP